MADFFDNLPHENARELKALSILIYELRENRHAVLRRYGVDSAEALLEQIRNGTVAEHPAYEHYLAARVLDDTRHEVRDLVNERLREIQQS